MLKAVCVAESEKWLPGYAASIMFKFIHTFVQLKGPKCSVQELPPFFLDMNTYYHNLHLNLPEQCVYLVNRTKWRYSFTSWPAVVSVCLTWLLMLKSEFWYWLKEEGDQRDADDQQIQQVKPVPAEGALMEERSVDRHLTQRDTTSALHREKKSYFIITQGGFYL